MKVNNHNIYNNTNKINFNAKLTLKHSLNFADSKKYKLPFSDSNPILAGNFVDKYTEKVSRLGKDTDTVEITVQPYSGRERFLMNDYTLDVIVVRNNEKYQKAKGLLLCPDIKESLPAFLEDEYKWLIRWFKDKNGTEKL
jgi:hypothetical protein